MNINVNIKQSHLVLLVSGQIFGAGTAPTHGAGFVASMGFYETLDLVFTL